MSSNATNLLINCDMGEWDAPHLDPHDEAIMPFIDLCNIACGGHAGNQKIMASTIDLAINNNVKVGAHPGYVDRKYFGRKHIALSPIKLKAIITEQIKLFLSICNSKSVTPYHIKAHGALYHACNQNQSEAEVLIQTILEICPELIVLVSKDSVLEKLASKEGLSTLSESFIDRRYNDEVNLVSRTKPNAVITDIEEATNQFKRLSSGIIKTSNGRIIPLVTKTACIHGDNPNCVQILKSIRKNAKI